MENGGKSIEKDTDRVASLESVPNHRDDSETISAHFQCSR